MQERNKNPGLRDIIIHKYPQLSKQERKVADYFVQNLQAFVVLTAKELARNTGVSEATIVRFAQNLGFSGFQHLKSRMVEEAKEKIMPEDRFKLMTPERNPESTVFKVAEQEVKNINLTIEALDPGQIRKFIRVLRNSGHIHTLGLGISSLMARVAAYLFNQAGARAFVCQKDEHCFIERLINLDRNDAVLAFSFPPYSKETIEAMKFCHEKGIQCLAITDKPTAPIVEWSRAHLIVRSDNLLFTNAISAIVMVLNALATELAFFNKERAADNSKLIYRMVKDEYWS